MTGRQGWLARTAAVLTVAGLTLVGLAAPAFAHNSLTGSDPADGASLAAGPSTVELRFDQPVQDGAGLTTVAVIGPDNGRWEAGPAQVSGNVVTAPVRELGPAGTYRIGYQVLSADGHPVSGELDFTLTTAGTGTPGPAVSQADGTDPTGSGTASGGGLPTWVWLAGAVLLLGVGLVVALRMGGTGEGKRNT